MVFFTLVLGMAVAVMILLTMLKISVSYSGKFFALTSIRMVLKQPMLFPRIILFSIWMGCGQKSGLMVFAIRGNLPLITRRVLSGWQMLGRTSKKKSILLKKEGTTAGDEGKGVTLLGMFHPMSHPLTLFGNTIIRLGNQLPVVLSFEEVPFRKSKVATCTETLFQAGYGL